MGLSSTPWGDLTLCSYCFVDEIFCGHIYRKRWLRLVSVCFLLLLDWQSAQSAQWGWWTSPWTATPVLSGLEAVSRTDVFTSRKNNNVQIHKFCVRFEDLFCKFFLIAVAFLDAYTSSEIMFTWRKGPVASVECPKESMSLLQYDLVGQMLSSEIFKSNTGNCQLSHHCSHKDIITVVPEPKSWI